MSVKLVPLNLRPGTVPQGDTVQAWGFVPEKPRLDPRIEHLIAMRQEAGTGRRAGEKS